jgi:2-methylisocitrate lyase-like PEP mutase family enzyme
MTQRDKALALRALHDAPEILILVNAWDVASARAVAALPGCRAVATASVAVAQSAGYPDGEVIPVDLVFSNLARICAAVDLPVTADLESGYGDLTATITEAIRLGAVGANLEDGMRPLDASVEAIEEALEAGRAAGVPLVLNARTDPYMIDLGLSDEAKFEEAVTRSRAYLAAGATCAFIPGVYDAPTIGRLVEGIGVGKINVIRADGGPTPSELQAMGVTRVSVGPRGFRAALAEFERYAAEMLRP